MTDLLDAAILIALTVPAHPHHIAARHWVDACPSFAVCPMTEGALARYLFRVSFPGRGAGATQEALALLRSHEGYEFWPDDLSYADAPLHRIRGHKQVTDAYLVALAKAHGGRLVTFDQALAATHPEAVLVPME